jgi:hypothetical protein
MSKDSILQEEVRKMLYAGFSKLPIDYSIPYTIGYKRSLGTNAVPVVFFLWKSKYLIDKDSDLKNKLHRPVFIPVKFCDIIESRSPNYMLLKIFLLDKDGIDELKQYLANEKPTYQILLDYIEKNRLRDFHKQLSGRDTEKEKFHELGKSLMRFVYMPEYPSFCVDVMDISYRILSDCCRKLKKHEQFSSDDLSHLTQILHLVTFKPRHSNSPVMMKKALNETPRFPPYWMKRNPEDKQKWLPPWIITTLKNRIRDAITEFIATLYDDLFKNMFRPGQFKICTYNNCNQIFQRQKDEDDHDWNQRVICNEKCGGHDYRMGYYNIHGEKERARRRDFWKNIESKKLNIPPKKHTPYKISRYFTNTTGI